MKIRTLKGMVPSQDLYSLQFIFQDFTEEEIFLFNKYGFISVSIPPVIVQDLSGACHNWQQTKLALNGFSSCKFLFKTKDSLEKFKVVVIDQIQEKLKKYLEDVIEFAGEDLYEVTIGGEIRKINEGAKKALDKSSPEYKEIIEKNREVFERLSKL